jgi:hypothetical protein
LTPEALFHGLAPLVGPCLWDRWQRRDLCVLATAVAIDVAAYFRIEAVPVPCKLVAYNAPFAKHVESGTAGEGTPQQWGDGSWSVGIGMGLPEAEGRWDGHLIVEAGGWFADYAIRQVERPEHNIITGDAIVGPLPAGGQSWSCDDPNTGTVVDYKRTGNQSFRNGPDWTHKARRRAIVGQLIRQIKKEEL